MVSDELGKKRTCPSCGARFYDLNKDPITCPKCAQAFVADPLLPSKGDGAAAKPKSSPKPAAKPDDEDDVEENENVVSLEDLEDDTDGAGDDETAGIEGVDLDDDDDNADEADVFLDDEEDESGGGVKDLIGGGTTKSGNDET